MQWLRSILLGFLLITPASAETLQQAWDIALDVNHSLKAAWENTAAAEQQLKAAESARLPTLVLEAGYAAIDNTPNHRSALGHFQ